jgi:hypothetical protein
MLEFFDNLQTLPPALIVVLAVALIAVAGVAAFYAAPTLPPPLTPPPSAFGSKDPKNCGECRFWRLKAVGGHKILGAAGYCAKYAPGRRGVGADTTKFALEWCGEGEKTRYDGPNPWGWQGYDESAAL